MTTVATTPSLLSTRDQALAAAKTALLVGIVSCITLTVVWFAATLTPDGHPFKHTADYVYTAVGIPFCAAPLALMYALRAIQGAPRRSADVGIRLASAALGLLIVMVTIGAVAGKAFSWGPTYILATFFGIVGVWLFCAGSAKTGVLRRWTVWFWAVAWTIGGTLGPKGSQILLAAAYLALYLSIASVGRSRVDSAAGIG
jgi:hypothetical protein